MDQLLDGLRQGLELIFSGDPSWSRRRCARCAIGFESTAIATLLGRAGRLRARPRALPRPRACCSARSTPGMRTPPVALGVLLWLLLWPDSRWGGGPLAGLGWIYTLNAVILAQTLLVLPIVVALTAAAVQRVPERPARPGARVRRAARGAADCSRCARRASACWPR